MSSEREKQKDKRGITGGIQLGKVGRDEWL